MTKTSLNFHRLRNASIDLFLVFVFLTLMGVSLSQLYQSFIGNSLLRTTNSNTVGVVNHLTNDVRIKERGDYRWYQVSQSLTLEEGDEIFTGAKSDVEIRVGEQVINLGSYTLAKIHSRSNAPEINLEFGEIEVDVSQPIVLASKGKRLNLQGDQTKARVKLRVGKKKAQLSVVSGKLKMAKNTRIVASSLKIDKSPLESGKAIDLDQIQVLDTSLESFSDPIVGDLTEEIRDELVGPTGFDKGLAALDRSNELASVEFEVLAQPELNLDKLEVEISREQFKSKSQFIPATEDQVLNIRSMNIEMGNRVFDFQISDRSDFSKVIAQRRIRQNKIALKKLPKENFYVRVRYYDQGNRDWSDFSETRRVDINVEEPERVAASLPPVGGLVPPPPLVGPPLPPKPVFLSSPKLKGLSDGVTFIANKKFPVVLRLDWDKTSFESGAFLEFELSRTRDFGKVVEKTKTSNSRLLFSKRLPPGSYFWRARVIRGEGNSRWSRPKKVIVRPIKWKGSFLLKIYYNNCSSRWELNELHRT